MAKLKVLLTLDPRIAAVFGYSPDDFGSTRVSAVLARYAAAVAQATRELETRFDREEWNLLADVLNGCASLWDWTEATHRPSSWLPVEVSDAQRLNRTGDKWFGDAKGKSRTAALAKKLATLTDIEGEALFSAIRYFWSCENVDMEGEEWWTLAHRTRNRDAACAE